MFVENNGERGIRLGNWLGWGMDWEVDSVTKDLGGILGETRSTMNGE